MTKKCPICGKIHNNNKFCSRKCQYESYKKPKEIVRKKCIFCNKEFEIDLNHSNDNKYCSRKCINDERKIKYKGEGNPMHGVIVSNETRKKHSTASKKMWKNDQHYEKYKNGIKKFIQENGHYPGRSINSNEKRKKTLKEKYNVENISQIEGSREKADLTSLKKHKKHLWQIPQKHKKKTKIEDKIERILIKNDIEFVYNFRIAFYDREKLRYKIYDFYLPSLKILIEADGDYWHGNPMFFSQLNETQKKNIENDKFKNRLASESGFYLLRYFESEINLDSFEHILIREINGKNKNN